MRSAQDPDLSTRAGDEVKRIRERVSNFSQNRYAVEKLKKGIGRPYLRFELLKVKTTLPERCPTLL